MSKEKADTRVCTVQFHLCEFQEQAKLIHSKRSQKSGGFLFLAGKGHKKSWGNGAVLYFHRVIGYRGVFLKTH